MFRYSHPWKRHPSATFWIPWGKRVNPGKGVIAANLSSISFFKYSFSASKVSSIQRYKNFRHHSVIPWSKVWRRSHGVFWKTSKSFNFQKQFAIGNKHLFCNSRLAAADSFRIESFATKVAAVFWDLRVALLPCSNEENFSLGRKHRWQILFAGYRFTKQNLEPSIQSDNKAARRIVQGWTLPSGSENLGGRIT